MLPGELVVDGIVSDQFRRQTEAAHDRVAGIDAQGAAYAGHLLTIADVDPGRAHLPAQAAVDAMAAVLEGLVVLGGAPRLPAPFLVGDDQRVLVEHGALKTRPRAHVDAQLFARPAGEYVSGGAEQESEAVDGRRRLTGEEVDDEGRRIDEVHDPGAAGRQGDQQPDRVSGQLLSDLGEGERPLLEANAGIAVTLDLALHPHEQVGPYRLRAGEPAPHPTKPGGGQKQPDSADDQQAGQVVDLLRPDLDEEEVGPPPRQVDQERLIGSVRAAVPTNPRADVVESEEDPQGGPLQPAEEALDAARVDLGPAGIERLFHGLRRLAARARPIRSLAAAPYRLLVHVADECRIHGRHGRLLSLLSRRRSPLHPLRVR